MFSESTRSRIKQHLLCLLAEHDLGVVETDLRERGRLTPGYADAEDEFGERSWRRS